MHTLEQLRAGALAGIQRLQLSCGLTEFPPEIFTLADSLEILDLSNNALSSLPDDLPRLHKLRVIFCSDNRFTALPEVLGRCPQLSMVGFKANRIATVSATALPARLRWLILTDNALTALPSAIGRCLELQKLMLAGNRLTSLPPELTDCHQLELLRIAANQLPALPDWLVRMPRLSWLAFGGNPFCAEREAAVLADMPIPPIAWPLLSIHHKLGEGASGVIHAAGRPGEPPVFAVKLFKGAVTSDGLPLSEMAACLAACSVDTPHANLIPVIGRVHDHPDGVQGLVMPLVEADLVNLAGPPSLASCTRDIYAEGKRFDAISALLIAKAIASAAAHVHARGVMHGDLYGHNILHSKSGPGLTMLGDFGAASLLGQEAVTHAAALQRLEVRAFGCLLEELTERCDGAPTALAMAALAVTCMQADTAARPLFAQLDARLDELLMALDNSV